MRRCARWMPLFALVACLPLLAADDVPKKPDADKKGEMKKDDAPDKKDDKASAPAKPDPKAAEKKYAEMPPVTGRVMKIDSKTSELHVEVGFGRFAKTEEWTLAEDAKYLTRIPPETVDDKGKAKKITGPELQKLARDPKHTGCFVSNVNEVQKGQTVEVVLGRPKETGPKKPAAKGKKADEKEGLVVVRVTILRDDRGTPGRGDARMPPKKP